MKQWWRGTSENRKGAVGVTAREDSEGKGRQLRKGIRVVRMRRRKKEGKRGSSGGGGVGRTGRKEGQQTGRAAISGQTTGVRITSVARFPSYLKRRSILLLYSLGKNFSYVTSLYFMFTNIILRVTVQI